MKKAIPLKIFGLKYLYISIPKEKKRIDNINLTIFSRFCPELTSVPMMKLVPQSKVWSDREGSTDDSTIPN